MTHPKLIELLTPLEHKDPWDYIISSYDGNAQELAKYIVDGLENAGYRITLEP